jgi:hypothetical protein
MSVRRGVKLVVATGFLCAGLFAFVVLPQGGSRERAAQDARTPDAPALQTAAASMAPESGRREERNERVRPAPVQMRPLFDTNLRLKLGDNAMLKFEARDAVSGAPLTSRRQVTASLSDGRGPERPLEVREDQDGNYEVPFTPHGPGDFNVTLNVDGVPSGSQRIGVVGAAGRTDGVVDLIDPLSVDPRDYRARTGGQFHRR